jgi:hypothetical protein
MADPELQGALRDLMERLETVGAKHEEVYDTDVRERMSEAVHRAFLKPEPGYQFPPEYGMFEPEGNAAVRHALTEYVKRASARAGALGMSDPQERLAAFQDAEVATSGEGQTPDSFFGWADSV